MDVTLDIALIKSRSDSLFPNTIGAINYRNSGPFFAGTAVTNSSNLTVIVAGVNWTTNPWAGYTVRLRIIDATTTRKRHVIIYVDWRPIFAKTTTL
jgi:hypothetical protein